MRHPFVAYSKPSLDPNDRAKGTVKEESTMWKHFGYCLIAVATLVTPASADLIGYWNFDSQDLVETSGYQAAGVHDGEAYGTVNYTTDTANGLNGYALNLTGGDNAVLVKGSNRMIDGSANDGVTNNPDYVDTFDAHINSTQQLTVALWVKGWPASYWQPCVSKKGEDDYGYQLRRYDFTDNATFTVRGTPGTDDPQGGIDVNDGEWHHLVGVWDGVNGNRYLYVDGVLDTAGSITDGSDNGTMNAATDEYLVFGARDSDGGIGSFSQVMLDDIRIYDEAISESQVRELAGVPEPATWLLLLVGGVALVAYKGLGRRK